VATYVPYRAAALRAFDLDLRDNLDTLQNALAEELREANAKARENPTDPAAASPLRAAAKEALEEFRLTRLFAEIRSGASAETPIAGLESVGGNTIQAPLTDADWARLAAGPAGKSRVLILPRGMRGVARTFVPAGSQERVTMIVADRTRLVDQALSSMRMVLVEYGIAGLVLALVGGYWVARRALKPIEVLTAQASAMAAAPSTPGGRLDVPNREDELGQLGLSFNLLLERIEQSLNRTRAFIADAAHELKTPVAIVRTEAELSLSQVRSLDESREALSAIASESTRLSRLVSNLTLLAEGETLEHPLERRLVDLTELVHEVVRSLRPLATSREATVEVDAPPGLEFRGDERLLRQILVNLVENAIKFSRPPARIGISVDQEDGRVEVRVLDEAATLSADEREKVFERFYRSRRSAIGSAPGSGLGLAIVRWAVALHGGSIRIEPRSASTGNAFIAEFPLAPGAEASPPPQ